MSEHATIEDVRTLLSVIPTRWLTEAEAIIRERIQTNERLEAAVARLSASGPREGSEPKA